MGTIKDIFKGPHKRFAWFAVISTAVLLFFWIVGPGNTLIHWAEACMEIRRQEKAIRKYEAETAEMDRRIRMLHTDRDTLEKFAREQLHFAAPGDDVYIIEE
ncbi:MAG: septum formation initiator family protein [Bacteroidales bacterium]|nr:septum formation initiator family protein [Bacteroidales bacterium]